MPCFSVVGVEKTRSNQSIGLVWVELVDWCSFGGFPSPDSRSLKAFAQHCENLIWLYCVSDKTLLPSVTSTGCSNFDEGIWAFLHGIIILHLGFTRIALIQPWVLLLRYDLTYRPVHRLAKEGVRFKGCQEHGEVNFPSELQSMLTLEAQDISYVCGQR